MLTAREIGRDVQFGSWSLIEPQGIMEGVSFWD